MPYDVLSRYDNTPWTCLFVCAYSCAFTCRRVPRAVRGVCSTALRITASVSTLSIAVWVASTRPYCLSSKTTPIRFLSCAVVSKKLTLFYFCDYSIKCWPILIIFGSIAAEKIWKQMTFHSFYAGEMCYQIQVLHMCCNYTVGVWGNAALCTENQWDVLWQWWIVLVFILRRL